MMKAELVADLREAIAENPSTMVYQQQEVSGVLSDRVDTEEFGEGGITEDTEATFDAVLDDFTGAGGAPGIGGKVRVASRWFRVTQKTVDDFKAGVQFGLATTER